MFRSKNVVQSGTAGGAGEVRDGSAAVEIDLETAFVFLGMVPPIAFAVLFVSRGRILSRLRNHHPERWDFLGRPNPWLPRACGKSPLLDVGYLKKARHEGLRDRKLVRMVRVFDVTRWGFVSSLLGAAFQALYRVWSAA